jgi:hypothetical protein
MAPVGAGRSEGSVVYVLALVERSGLGCEWSSVTMDAIKAMCRVSRSSSRVCVSELEGVVGGVGGGGTRWEQ